jgi:hypothetical protein
MGLKKEIDIENYKDLLFAIFNTDKENNKQSIICVYDTKENEKLIAIFNSSKNCAKFFGTSARIIDCCICRKCLKQNRYRLERLKIKR